MRLMREGDRISNADTPFSIGCDHTDPLVDEIAQAQADEQRPVQ